MSEPETTAVAHHLAPRTGCAFLLPAGRTLRVVSPETEQVADLVAFGDPDRREWLSTGRTIDYGASLRITTGSVLYSNRSRPMFTITGDSVGCHDVLLTPCSAEMFEKLYDAPGHPSCLSNLAAALAPYGIGSDDVPTTVNLFMRVEVDGETGTITILPPPTRPGDAVELRAEMDLVVAVAACSAELTNNGSFKPIDLYVA